MERDGIIERRPDPADGRSALFSLTPRMKAQVPEIRAAIKALGNEAGAGLTSEERAAMDRALLNLSRTIEAALRDS